MTGPLMGSSPEPEAAAQNPYEARLKGNCQERRLERRKLESMPR